MYLTGLASYNELMAPKCDKPRENVILMSPYKTIHVLPSLLSILLMVSSFLGKERRDALIFGFSSCSWRCQRRSQWRRSISQSKTNNVMLLWKESCAISVTKRTYVNLHNCTKIHQQLKIGKQASLVKSLPYIKLVSNGLVTVKKWHDQSNASCIINQPMG